MSPSHSRPFQSTLPVGGSDLSQVTVNAIPYVISIHAPRGGERLDIPSRLTKEDYISIHAPRGGERPGGFEGSALHPDFNPRSPWGGATDVYSRVAQIREISIHAPRGGERPGLVRVCLVAQLISIHAPRGGERRGVTAPQLPPEGISIHAPRGGERPQDGQTPLTAILGDFNPRSPWGGATGAGI